MLNVMGDPIERLAGKIAAAEADAETKRAALGDAALVNETDGTPATAKRLDAAQRDLTNAENWLASLRAARRAAEAKAAHRAKDEAHAALVARWDAVEAGIKKREQASMNYEKAADTLFRAWQDIQMATEAIASAQVVTDPDGAVIKGAALERAMRLHLTKIGLRWAHQWGLQDPDSLPALSTQMAAASANIRNQRRG